MFILIYDRELGGRKLVFKSRQPDLYDAMIAVYRQEASPKRPTFLWPTEFPGHVTQAFGINPQWYEGLGVPAHEGIDMRAISGTRIFSVWDGEVSRVGEHPAYGNHIRIKHTVKGIDYESIYAHFVRPSHLEVGATVKRGRQIGNAGSTGNSTGAHLHFMLKQFNGKLPETYLQIRYANEWKKFNIVDPTPFFKELR